MRLTRRTWAWILGMVGGAALGVGLWAFWLEPASLTVSEHQVSLDWPAERSLRVAVLTDLHVGSPFNGIAKLRETVKRTNAAQPALICILGDLVIQGVLGGRFVPPEEIAEELKHLRAPAGVVAVLGNHDGWFDHDRVRDALERAGIRVLEDTAARLSSPEGPLWVAGVSDLWTGRHDLAAAMSLVNDVALLFFCSRTTLTSSRLFRTESPSRWRGIRTAARCGYRSWDRRSCRRNSGNASPLAMSSKEVGIFLWPPEWAPASCPYASAYLRQ